MNALLVIGGLWSSEVCLISPFPCRSELHSRGVSQQAESPPPEPEEEILGSDDEEQEDPSDYCKGESVKGFKRIFLRSPGAELRVFRFLVFLAACTAVQFKL